jgi:hypothetical protein
MPWGLGLRVCPQSDARSGCYPAASHNLASNKIDFKRFILFGINGAKVGELQNGTKAPKIGPRA